MLPPAAGAPLPTTGVAAAARLAFAAAGPAAGTAATARVAAAGAAAFAVPLGRWLVSAAAAAGPAVPALGGRRIATATAAGLPLWAARPLSRTPPMRSCI
jgi:hypothetical protein